VLAACAAVLAVFGSTEPARAQLAVERLYECTQLAGPDEYARGFSLVGRPSVDALGRVVFAALGDFDSELARCCRQGVSEIEVFERQVSCPGGPGEELSAIADPEVNALGQVVYRADACGESSFLYLSQNAPAIAPQRIVEGVVIEIAPPPALGGSRAYYAGFVPAGAAGLFAKGFGGAGPGQLLLPDAILDVAASGVTGDWAALVAADEGGTELVVNGGPPPFSGLGDFASLSVAETFAYPRVAYVTVDPEDPSRW
jgi:hypothetical protein